MYLHWVFCSLALVWLASAEVCKPGEYFNAYTELLYELNVQNSSVMQMRPISDTIDTKVLVYLLLTSITEVNEKAQSISTQVIIAFNWTTAISWQPTKYCDIDSFAARKEMFWTPDIVVVESVKTEVAVKESPYVQFYFNGYVWTMDILSLTTTCKMDLYNFPFDKQTCSLTLQSLAYKENQLKLMEGTDQVLLTIASKENFQTEGEWELLYINTTTTYSDTLWVLRSRIAFKIIIKRRPLLYIINLIFPVFCFLVLDVASFFIKASVAEKLGFKVTLLLSISVLLLILNDKLPSTSRKVPLIGIYCIGVFTFIGISILETIFLNLLISKGEETKSGEPAETKDAATDNEDGVDMVTSRIEQPTCTVNTRKKASLYCNRAAIIIDVIFIVLYIIAIIVFLTVLGKMWFHFE